MVSVAGFGDLVRKNRKFVVGFGLHLFGEVSGLVVAAHFDLKQWAKS